jgi:hypothetical protein
MLRLLPVNTLRVPTKTSWFPVPPLAYRLARRPFPVVFFVPGYARCSRCQPETHRRIGRPQNRNLSLLVVGVWWVSVMLRRSSFTSLWEQVPLVVCCCADLAAFAVVSCGFFRGLGGASRDAWSCGWPSSGIGR